MKALKSITSIILVLITLLTLFIPAVSAAENGIIEDFKIEFVSGADYVDGKYVFDATNDNSGLRWNRFIYRVNYALSGEGMLQPGKVKITLPTSIITDRDGNIADEFDIAVPHADDVEETDNEVKFVYIIENDDTIVITNRLEISSAQAGNIEIAYIPTKSEINYVDMKKSADVTSTFTLGEGGAGYTRTSTADGVYFDTSAVNQSTEVKLSDFSLNWNSAWGLPKPENDDQYCYIVWSVKTSLSNATQYYDFQINSNVITDNGEAIGYKFQNQTKYVSENHIEHQNSHNTYSDYIKYRYDYVLTKHLKSEVLVNECMVEAKNTSQICSFCGSDDEGQLINRDTFICKNSECESHKKEYPFMESDFNAARNIAKSTSWVVK